MILGLPFKSLIHFEFIFIMMQVMGQGPYFFFSHETSICFLLRYSYLQYFVSDLQHSDSQFLKIIFHLPLL